MNPVVAVRPIYTDADLDTALARLDEIFDAEPHSREGHERSVLAVLIEAYEREHHSLGPSDPVEAIRFHLDRLGLHPADLVPYVGDAASVDEVLDRKRALTVAMIRKLHEGLGIPVESLIGT